MDNNWEILFNKIESIESLLRAQSLVEKEVLNFEEACAYLQLSESHLYRLTSKRLIPHSCPNGKKLYFKRTDLENWMLQNPQFSLTNVEKDASEFVRTHKMNSIPAEYSKNSMKHDRKTK